MELIDQIQAMQTFSKQLRKEGKIIGFVPTMGYLHEGHLSLIRQARKECDTVIISIYVNPTQFGGGEDYERYPRDIERDKRLAREEGVDIIFSPTDSEMYPEEYSSFVEVEKLTENLCGRSRPGHFRGVTTVVIKLFNIVQPDIAYFGQKDMQQAIVIKRMVRDLNIPIEIKVLPIIREKNGLVLSSRNEYLNPEERRAAPILYRSLERAKSIIGSGEKESKRIINEMKGMIQKEGLVKIDYISIVDPETLENLDTIKDGALIAMAVWIGKTRLIDNIVVK